MIAALYLTLFKFNKNNTVFPLNSRGVFLDPLFTLFEAHYPVSCVVVYFTRGFTLL